MPSPPPSVPLNDIDSKDTVPLATVIYITGKKSRKEPFPSFGGIILVLNRTMPVF